MGLLARSDQAAGTVARVAATIGQMALVGLGVHLAADQLDDRVLDGLVAIQGLLDSYIAGPTGSLAEFLGWESDALWFWEQLPVAAMAAWFALVIELATDVLLCSQFLLTSRKPELSWSIYKRALSIRAVVMPITLTGVLIAGSWSLAMAAEDVLPDSDFAPWAAGIVGVAALARFGGSAWIRAVAALDPPPRWTQGLRDSLLLVPMGLLAWMHGVPIWGWLP